LNFLCCDTTVSWQDTHKSVGQWNPNEVDKKITQTLKTIRIFYFATEFFGWAKCIMAHPKQLAAFSSKRRSTRWPFTMLKLRQTFQPVVNLNVVITQFLTNKSSEYECMALELQYNSNTVLT
jgi:hypothetical protein